MSTIEQVEPAVVVLEDPEPRDLDGEASRRRRARHPRRRRRGGSAARARTLRRVSSSTVTDALGCTRWMTARIRQSLRPPPEHAAGHPSTKGAKLPIRRTWKQPGTRGPPSGRSSCATARVTPEQLEIALAREAPQAGAAPRRDPRRRTALPRGCRSPACSRSSTSSSSSSSTSPRSKSKPQAFCRRAWRAATARSRSSSWTTAPCSSRSPTRRT